MDVLRRDDYNYSLEHVPPSDSHAGDGHRWRTCPVDANAASLDAVATSCADIGFATATSATNSTPPTPSATTASTDQLPGNPQASATALASGTARHDFSPRDTFLHPVATWCRHRVLSIELCSFLFYIFSFPTLPVFPLVLSHGPGLSPGFGLWHGPSPCFGRIKYPAAGPVSPILYAANVPLVSDLADGAHVRFDSRSANFHSCHGDDDGPTLTHRGSDS
ncbi:hypothetical protein BGW38_009145, partial [Lunasporangiospora selenospora]